MATPIGVRSPRIVDISGSVNDATKVELYLWNDPDSIPVSPTYTLEKPIPSSSVTEASYDISPYCREYIAHTSYTEVTSLTASPVGEYCWCTVKEYLNGTLQLTTEYLCFDGWGYFSQGENPQQGDVYMTEGTYYVSDTGNTGGLYYSNEVGGTWTAVYTGLKTGGTTTVSLTQNVGYIPYVHTSYVGEGNTLEIKQNGTLKKTYTFEEVCEPKYTTINCDFVNKFGTWQRLVFFKLSKESIAGENTQYNLMSASTTYDVNEGRRKVFNANAQEAITCNTGWVPESYKNVIKEMVLSETILLDDAPVILDKGNIDLQKGINDKNINYTLSFKYAYHALNYNI